LGSNDRSTLELFGNEIAVGDVLLCIGSNTEVAAIGIVSGNYRYEATPPSSVRADYKNVLPVNWIVTDCNFSILNLNSQKRFTLKTVYEITRFSWPELLKGLSAAGVDLKAVGPTEITSAPFVLIIDEINRGNVSQIFGELITLIEADKRLGKDEALEVSLPYSKEKFGVPPNLYIIGTMNTADRSVEALDTALRRRFSFTEMPPHYDLYGMNYEFAGVNGAEILRKINKRIEKLLDRDHLIGHSYFLLNEEEKLNPEPKLLDSFYRNIIPLLQEYFFGDYAKIGAVLGNGFIYKENEDDQSDFGVGYENEDFAEKDIFQIIDYRTDRPGNRYIETDMTFKKAIRLLVNLPLNKEIEK
jgi:5-methylcytosine-specific restriction protein B